MLAPLRGRISCLQKPPQDPEVADQIAPRGEADRTGGQLLACARCLREVTTSQARIAVAGSHEHRFSNPDGVRFQIGCFAGATGCRTVGPRSTYWTWFSGYSWQVEVCGACAQHLGWLFRADAHHFHGLIVDRLVELESGG